MSFVGSYFLFSNIQQGEYVSDLDARFDDVVNELEQYGGAMIVSYDTETGEITGKRRVKEAGVLSVTEEEYEQNKDFIPKGSLIAKDTLTPRQAIEYISS